MRRAEAAQLGRADVVHERVVAQQLKRRQRAAAHGRRAGSRRIAQPRVAVERGERLGRVERREHAVRADRAARDERGLEKVRVLGHAARAHGSAQVRAVDLQLHIASGKAAVAQAVGKREHLREIRAVELEVRCLRIGRARQDRGGADHGLRQNGRDVAVVLLEKRREQFLRRHGAALRQDRIALHAHRPRLDERLGIVVVILEAEQLHELRLRDHALDLIEQRRDVRLERSAGFLRGQAAQVAVAAFLQDLGRLVVRGRVDHALHALSGKHFGLAGCQHCRNRKVIRIFYFRQFDSSLMRRSTLRPI